MDVHRFVIRLLYLKTKFDVVGTSMLHCYAFDAGKYITDHKRKDFNIILLQFIATYVQ